MEEKLPANPKGIRAVVEKHGQILFNIFLFVLFSVVVGKDVYEKWSGGKLDYVEIAFVAQNLIMVTFILIRKQHQSVDRNLLHQAVAMIAFFSGAAIFGQPATGGETAQSVSKMIIFAANVLGAITILNLGRSFGILIAYREIKTGGLYAVVRHPMYGTDILLRVGFIVSHFSWLNLAIVIASTGCYLYRAVLEERFLQQQW